MSGTTADLSPDVQRFAIRGRVWQLTDLGLHVAYETQGQFAGRVRTYTQTWAKIIQDSGFKPQ